MSEVEGEMFEMLLNPEPAVPELVEGSKGLGSTYINVKPGPELVEGRLLCLKMFEMVEGFGELYSI